MENRAVFRRVTICLLTAVLLACPYVCRAEFSSDTPARAGCCPRCPAPPAPAQETGAPADDEKGNNCCLCSGAVLGEAATDLSVMSDVWSWLPAPLVVAALPQAGATGVPSAESWACPSGGSLRIAIRSFLC